MEEEKTSSMKKRRSDTAPSEPDLKKMLKFEASENQNKRFELSINVDADNNV